MKRFFTLIAVCVAALSAMAQMHGDMKFIGNAQFYLPAMQAQTLTNIKKDTVKVTMGTDTQSITFPDMTYAAMNMTIKSFTVPNLTYTMTGSYMTGDMAFTWSSDGFTVTTVGSDGQEKTVRGTALSAKYTHVTGSLEVAVTFTYGTMPMSLAYSLDGYYTVQNAWNLIGRGTEGNPYKVYDAADFRSIASNISKDNKGTGEFFQMMDDVDFGGTAETPVQLPAIGKAAITNISTVAYGFNGIFNGNSHSISGIYHTDNGNDIQGKFNALFSSIDTSGVVRDITFSADNHINSYNYVGTVASISKGTIENCTNNANVTVAGAFGAGICGYMASGIGTIKNCVNNGNIQAMTYANGIVSGSQSGTAITNYAYLVEGCTNNGNISTGNGVGSAGIAGSYSGTIRSCTNTGTIDDTAKAGQYTAGITSACSYLVAIEGCTNSGSILGTKNIGGIAGHIMKGNDTDVSISGCTNSGAVTAAGANVGGILGNSARVNGTVALTGCTNNGVVSSTGTTELIGNLRGNAAIVLGNGNTIAAGLAILALDPAGTGVQEVINNAANAQKGKFIRNGRFVIVKSGKTYGVSGIEEK